MGWISIAGILLGKLIYVLIFLMNRIIIFFNTIPHVLLTEISVTIPTTVLLYVIVVTISVWLIHKNCLSRKLVLASSLLCLIFLIQEKWNLFRQRKIIVYNIPHHRSIDFIKRDEYFFVGDDSLNQVGPIQTYTIAPARLQFHLFKHFNLAGEKGLYFFEHKKILLIDSTIHFKSLMQMDVDLIILSKNPKILIAELTSFIKCNHFVFDASNNLWKIAIWEKECKRLNLHSHSCPKDGAFIINL